MLLFVLVAVSVAGAAALYVAKDWLVALGVRVGIAEYNARLNSTLNIEDVSLDVFSLTVTVRGITIAERGQTPLGAPICIRHVQAKVRLWPLIQRRIVIDEVSASEAMCAWKSADRAGSTSKRSSNARAMRTQGRLLGGTSSCVVSSRSG